jgi:hypothetical protein
MAILTNAQPEVTATNTVTLTNKTLTAPTISDPTFTGTTTNINTTNLVVEDKNIVINDVTSPSDANADGGGISLNGATTKTLNWVDATDAWTSSEHLNLASGKSYYVNGTLLKDVSETLTNKTISLGSNTVSTTLAELNTAVSDADVVSLAGSETLTNKTLTAPAINGGVLDEVVLNAPEERTTISATAAGSTVQFDVKTQGVLYYTTNSSGNWTLNVRGDDSTTLNSLMTTGDALTVVFLATNGSPAYYSTALTIDGSAVTPKFQNGVAFASGNINSIDIYTYTIIKTASATFTVLAGQTRFA